jgi:putative transposase
MQPCRYWAGRHAWLWRSVKYEEVYLKAYDSVGEARTSIGRSLDFYDGRRPHSSLDGATLDQALLQPIALRLAA